MWFDALSNYLSGCDFPDGSNAHFWPAGVHLIGPPDCLNVQIYNFLRKRRGTSCSAEYACERNPGKDIIWFHCVIWPCMLMSCGLPLPKCVLLTRYFKILPSMPLG